MQSRADGTKETPTHFPVSKKSRQTGEQVEHLRSGQSKNCWQSTLLVEQAQGRQLPAGAESRSCVGTSLPSNLGGCREGGRAAGDWRGGWRGGGAEHSQDDALTPSHPVPSITLGPGKCRWEVSIVLFCQGHIGQEGPELEGWLHGITGSPHKHRKDQSSGDQLA